MPHSLSLYILPFITALFTVNAVVNMLGFIPQIYKLATATGRSEAIAISSWAMWAYTSTIGLSYALFVAHAYPLAFGYILNICCHLTMVSLTVYNRYFRFNESLPHGVSTTAANQLKLEF